MSSKLRTVAFAAALLAGCARPSPARSDATGRDTPATDDRSSPLIAHITPERLIVEAGATPELTLTIENRSAAPQQLDVRVLRIPQLALTVTRGGQRVAPMSPPVPSAPRDGDTVTLAPGASHQQRLTLTAFSPPLSPGEYVVRASGYPGGSAVVIMQ